MFHHPPENDQSTFLCAQESSLQRSRKRPNKKSITRNRWGIIKHPLESPFYPLKLPGFDWFVSFRFTLSPAQRSTKASRV